MGNSIVDKLAKKYQGILINTLADDLPKVDMLSTGSLQLDAITGGGFPRGRISVVWGPPSGGKSTLMMYCAAQTSKHGKVMFIDAENGFEQGYAKQIVEANKGRPENIVVVQPFSGSEALQVADEAINEKFDLVVIDSVPALTTSAELNASDPEDTHWAALARLLSRYIKATRSRLNQSNTALVFVNQVRASMEQYVEFNMPGGYELRHAAWLHLLVRRVGRPIMSGDEMIGIVTRVRVNKNKVRAAGEKADVELIFGVGVDRYNDTAQAAISSGIIKQTGAWFSFGDHKWHGRNGVTDALRNDEALYDAVVNEVMKCHNNKEANGHEKQGEEPDTSTSRTT